MDRLIISLKTHYKPQFFGGLTEAYNESGLYLTFIERDQLKKHIFDHNFWMRTLIKILWAASLKLIPRRLLIHHLWKSEHWFLREVSIHFFTKRPLVAVECNVSKQLQPNLEEPFFRQLLAFLSFLLSGLILHSRSLKKVNIGCPKPV